MLLGRSAVKDVWRGGGGEFLKKTKHVSNMITLRRLGRVKKTNITMYKYKCK